MKRLLLLCSSDDHDSGSMGGDDHDDDGLGKVSIAIAAVANDDGQDRSGQRLQR